MLTALPLLLNATAPLAVNPELRFNNPPPYIFPAIPTPPATVNAPVIELPELVVLPTLSEPPIPTPPETTKAPVVVFVEAVACVIETTPPVASFVNVDDPETVFPAEA